MKLAGSHLRAALAWCGFFACLCSRAAPAQSSLRDHALSAYFENKPNSALLLFRAAVKEHPRDAALLAWFGEVAARLGNASDAASATKEALRVDPCNAHAHIVRAYLFMPRFATAPHEINDDSVWSHLTRAVQCDSADGNALAYVWKYALIRGDTAAESRRDRQFDQQSHPKELRTREVRRSAGRTTQCCWGTQIGSFAGVRPISIELAGQRRIAIRLNEGQSTKSAKIAANSAASARLATCL